MAWIQLWEYFWNIKWEMETGGKVSTGMSLLKIELKYKHICKKLHITYTLSF